MIDLPCAKQDWPRFSELLDAAMDQPDDSRKDRLKALAGEDARLRPMLEALFCDAPNPDTAGLVCPPLPEESWFKPGTRVGPFELVALLGKGGMGEVWRASRKDDGPQREVALKLPHPELIGNLFLSRFTRERDVLASLSHPAIAQLYDAGRDSTGFPYLVLELVEGESITTFCSRRQVGLEQRIDLMCKILTALSYAHQHLVVHRDIKPGNVLVTSSGDVKVLDFGIAKLLRPDASAEEALTQATPLATPTYAAPEQLAGGTITVATDVFASAILLFELVTGHRPFERVPLDFDAPEAPLASQRAQASVAGIPGSRPLSRRLRGDLDAIIGKALALDPGRRYASAEAFADDLRRWRSGLPIRARRVGVVTRARKFARRNKAGVSLAAFLLVSLIAGTAGVAWQAENARIAAARAEAEAKRATGIKDFLIGLFKNADPYVHGTLISQITAKDLLDAGFTQLDSAFANDPATEMDLLQTWADIYDSLSDPVDDMKAFERRLALSKTHYGPADERTIEYGLDLAYRYAQWSAIPKALAVLEATREPILAKYGMKSMQRAQWLEIRAEALRFVPGRIGEAVESAASSVDLLQMYFPQDRELADALIVLEKSQFTAEDFEAALATGERAHQVALTRNETGQGDELAYEFLTGKFLENLGRLDEAEARFAAGQKLAEQMYGRAHFRYVDALDRRANLDHIRGDRARALTMFQEALSVSEKSQAAGDNTVVPPRKYPLALAREGRAVEAIPLLEQALATPAAIRVTPDIDVIRLNQLALGDAYDQVGRTADARRLLLAVRDAWLTYGPPHGDWAHGARERWARFLLDHGATKAAEVELRAILDDCGATPSAPAALAEAGLARVALIAGDAKAAAAMSQRAVQMIGAVKREYDVRAQILIWLVHAEALVAAGDADVAKDWAANAVAAANLYDAPESRQLAQAHDTLNRVEKKLH